MSTRRETGTGGGVGGGPTTAAEQIRKVHGTVRCRLFIFLASFSLFFLQLISSLSLPFSFTWSTPFIRSSLDEIGCPTSRRRNVRGARRSLRSGTENITVRLLAPCSHSLPRLCVLTDSLPRFRSDLRSYFLRLLVLPLAPSAFALSRTDSFLLRSTPHDLAKYGRVCIPCNTDYLRLQDRAPRSSFDNDAASLSYSYRAHGPLPPTATKPGSPYATAAAGGGGVGYSRPSSLYQSYSYLHQSRRPRTPAAFAAEEDHISERSSRPQTPETDGEEVEEEGEKKVAKGEEGTREGELAATTARSSESGVDGRGRREHE
jgi:hypothetical protein